MGRMVDGQWYAEEEFTQLNKSGAYEREDSVIRNWLGDEAFPAEPGRYHLYVAYNCPWAHRALIMRAVKKLEDIISVSFVAPRRSEQGWVFDQEFQDDLYDYQYLHQLYSRGAVVYSGRVTVPILWDKKALRIVSNESADIVRMFNSAFSASTADTIDCYPVDKREAIDKWNAIIYSKLNNGVYRAGFARSQAAYEAGVKDVFATLEQIESVLCIQDYLTGDQPTEADWRLFPTLVRFDVAYFGAFKCNIKRIIDYPHIWDYAKRLYHYPGIAKTVRFDIYKKGYFSPSEQRNPLGIVPLGPIISWD